MISDVPVGAFLSGGLDSGSLVAMAAQMQSEPVPTYTASWFRSGSGFAMTGANS
jgi:asparagine synthase (glutamine-hydrolysing)